VSQTPAVTGKQVIKALEGQGWYVKRVRHIDELGMIGV
jgi:predicted RNA binding protein YcfA (HicA-like mRNA interferase family)